MPLLYGDLNLVYVTGDGDIGFGACRSAPGSFDTLRICVLASPMAIGSDALGFPESSDFGTFIHFGCVASLDVLLDVLGKIRASMIAARSDPGADRVRTTE